MKRKSKIDVIQHVLVFEDGLALKRGQEPIVRSTLRAIWLLVPDPFLSSNLSDIVVV